VIVVDDGSLDRQATSEICNQYQAQVIRLDTSCGPAAARNAAIASVGTELIAFLDSDCMPQDGWINHLAGHFVDPLVGAVAPRIVGDEEDQGSAISRFSAAYSPLDLAQHPARVAPGARVSYVPTAVLLVRRDAIDAGFDPTLRYGEDVDFIWRLHDAGWRVRYDPSVLVKHPEPQKLMKLLARRFRYGTSAAPLAARHPERLSPLLIAPSSAALVAAALAGRPLSTATIAAVQAVPFTRRLGKAGVPFDQAARWSLQGAGHTFLATGRAMTALTPWLLAAGIRWRHTRRASLALIACPPLFEWARRKPPLGPATWTALTIADNIAYGTGVWVGSIRARTWSALVPKISSSAKPR
jgi:mycofactocin system glycosyltransferase